VKQESEIQVSALFEEAGRYAAIQLGVEEVRHLRHVLHELANVLTGMMVTGGLLHQALKGDLRQRYTGEICTGGDRGAELVREAREVLMGSEESLR
jgi:nitrogen-specific signal transduction histidine kinase